jgi:hypothetical protein
VKALSNIGLPILRSKHAIMNILYNFITAAIRDIACTYNKKIVPTHIVLDIFDKFSHLSHWYINDSSSHPTIILNIKTLQFIHVVAN